MMTTIINKLPDILEILLIKDPNIDHPDIDYWNKLERLTMIIYCVRKIRIDNKSPINFGNVKEFKKEPFVFRFDSIYPLKSYIDIDDNSKENICTYYKKVNKIEEKIYFIFNNRFYYNKYNINLSVVKWMIHYFSASMDNYQDLILCNYV